MQRDELQIKVNQKLQEISMELKTIPNIGSDYMEYISALICVMFENYEEFKLILIKYENDEKEIVNFLDRELYEIKWNYNAKLLFKNIRFSDKLNQIDYMKIKNVLRELNLLILDLKSAKQEGKNILAEAFEYIIMKSAQSNENPFRKGAFYTPKGLIKIMLKLLKMEDQRGIYNPACGTGNFIVESAKIADIHAFGEEKDIGNYNICMTNLWLHDISKKLIKERFENGLENISYAVSNPPFKLDDKEEFELNKRFYAGYNITKNTDSYIKILVKMLNTINERGRMAIILPQGFLFKKSNVEYSLRQDLIHKKYIDCIIELPEKLFYDTKIPVIILVIDKGKKNDDILFINASNEYSSKRKTNILTIENQEKIVEIYNKRETIKNISCLTNLEKVIENDYDLNIKKYIEIKSEVEEINQYQIETKIDKLEDIKFNIQQEIAEVIYDIKNEF